MRQPKLITNRLVLRRFEQSDAPEVERMAGNPDVALMTLNIPQPYLSGMGCEWISTHQSGWEERSNISYAIVLAETDQLIGAIGLNVHSTNEAELGYWIGQEYWGYGYCTEAAQKLIEFGFRELGLTRITARHLANNPASGRVMHKCGMSMVGVYQGDNRNNETAEFVHYEVFHV